MKVYKEIDWTDLREMSWSGGRDTIEALTDEQLEQIFDILEEECEMSYEDPTETTINDFFWFERETIAQWLGFDSFEQLEKANNGEEDEEENEEDEEDE